MSHESPNYSVNPTAGGRRPPSCRVGHSPAAGYAERWADKALLGGYHSRLQKRMIAAT